MMTMVIAIPTGVKVFNWIFTMFRGRVIFSSMMHWYLGFVAAFAVGGMTGVLLSIPAADFELHNSLFLVAHFHNMLVSGVLFGYFAGISYWFPKIFGFKLNEKLGIYAFWCWIIGFFVAFIPLYILGFMGATRRLDHYDPSLGWQSLFIVAGFGLGIIMIGVLFQVAQFYLSIRDRKKNISGPDPWNGRTLEWSVPSPAPFYNFARIPTVFGRDAFWNTKEALGQNHEAYTSMDGPSGLAERSKEKQIAGIDTVSAEYEDIELPRNTPFGLYIGLISFLIGFGIVWHMYWLVPLGLIALIVVLIIRSLDENTEEIFTAAQIEAYEKTYI
jgi:cytochrome o ubiquinol oxidase subunit 1